MDQEHVEEEQDPKLAQANKLFQTGVMLIYGKRKSVDKAIKCVQKAITLNDSDYKYWQLLGEAYYQRGSLNPSINCFMKSLALAENEQTGEKRVQADCTYSQLRMSDIRLSVTHLDEASAGYSGIISSDPKNVAALIGLSKVELMKSRHSFSSGLVISGHSHCMTALKYALEATKLSPNLCLTWKLASDCCITQFVYGQRGSYVSKIDIVFPGSDDDGLLIDRTTCIELAQQFLCKALAIEPFQESGCLWHNLGVSLYLKSTIVRDPTEKRLLLRRSLKCLFKALDNDRDNSQVRNSVGVVTFNLNCLNSAQNFIIKSIQTNMSTSEIQFSNLGYIYLQKGEYRLATTAFSRCQAEEPLYCRSWLGNAILNEQNNIDNLSYLRHCHRLENNYESQVMYATKITSLPMSAEYSKDLVNALDSMKRIINYDRSSLEVVNTLGLLYERCNYHEQAHICFEKANRLNQQDSRVILNRLRQHDAMASGCAISPDASSRIDTDFIKAAEKLANGNNREYLLNFIYYLFRNQDYVGVNSRMTKVIEKLGQSEVNNKIGAQVVLALAAKASGDDFKSWLFKNIIDSENVICVESLINLLSLIIFGSTTNDQQLMEQVSTDLSKYLIVYLSTKRVQFADFLQSSEGFWTRFTLISSIFCLADQGKLVRPLVALYPMIPELWLYLGLSLMHQKGANSTAIYCVKKASLIGSTDTNLCFVCDIILAILSQQPTKTKNKNVPEVNPESHINRAIFRHPRYGILWKFMEGDRNPKDKHHVRDLFDLAIDHSLSVLAS